MMRANDARDAHLGPVVGSRLGHTMPMKRAHDAHNAHLMRRANDSHDAVGHLAALGWGTRRT